MIKLFRFQVCWVIVLLVLGCGKSDSVSGQTDKSFFPPQALPVVDTPTAPTKVVLSDFETRFEREILKFEELERESPSPKGGILFTGSSSIRIWHSLAADMAPLPVINRGFGGSTLRQVSAYAERIIYPLEPAMIVLYCGENDICNEKFPAESAFTDFQHLVKLIRFYLPDTPILYLSMKPSPKRWKYWEKFESGNKMISDWCENEADLSFLDVGKGMLKPNGQVLKNIFKRDQLHMNSSGYEIWTRLIKPVVEEIYQQNTP